uniref:Uncharacterized protein n=1 Tax=Arundo donax TaxID=35708 RepID=A0A0A8XR35_ARUDO
MMLQVHEVLEITYLSCLVLFNCHSRVIYLSWLHEIYSTYY